MKKIVMITLMLVSFTLILVGCKKDNEPLDVIVLDYYRASAVEDGKQVNFFYVIVVEDKDFESGKMDFSSDKTYLIRIDNKLWIDFKYGDRLEAKRKELKLNKEKVVLGND